MKTIFKLFGLCTALISSGAYAAPSYLQKDSSGGYNVTYDYTDKAKSGWYVGGRADLNLLSWTNKYSTSWQDAAVNNDFSEDKYSFESLFGANLYAGKRFAYFWRAELEAGYMGYFEDKDNYAEFSLSVPYMMANLYYDFINGFYVGAGVGVAMPTTTLDGVFFDYEKRKETGFAPVAGIMLGYSYELDYNLTLDLRYRFAGMTGLKHQVDMENYLKEKFVFENKIDAIFDNSLSIGIRYEF